jgi:DNA-directed RNA polymerase specialized sigma24 family protein
MTIDIAQIKQILAQGADPPPSWVDKAVAALGKLPPETQLVWIKYSWHGLSDTEVADELHIALDEVRQRLREATAYVSRPPR